MEYTTIEEIEEQPEAIDAILDELRDRESEIANLVDGDTTFCLTGCGTSHYLSLSGSAILNQVATSVAVPGSEALVSPGQLPDEVDVIVPVSRSGESTETVRATEALQDQYPSATVIGLTCTAGSSIHEIADVPVVSPAGEEDSVVMTKSFSSMLVAFEFIARTIESENGATGDSESSIAGAFEGLAADSEVAVERSKAVVRDLGEDTSFEKFFFLGPGEFFGLASEGMLKLEEMTLSWTKAYHALEFRHGPQSIADEDTLVTVFVPDREVELHADLLEDIDDLGATTLAIGTAEVLDAVAADHTVEVPDREVGELSLYTPPFQLLGFYRAVATDLNPDEPKNLTQVVTF